MIYNIIIVLLFYFNSNIHIMIDDEVFY